ncbi:MAG: D-alanine--D-alanine ligase [Candidatus Krumholzibacteriia bacterium]
MKIWVLHNRVPADADPDDRDVLDQAAAVADGLAACGHAVTVADTDSNLVDLAQRLSAGRPDLVFNLVESLDGHGRLIHVVPSLLDALGIRYTGCPSEAILLTSHKLLAKGLLRRAGLSTPDWIVNEAELVGLARGGLRWEHPHWIVKSVWEDASLGIDDSSVVSVGTRAIQRALAVRAGRRGGPWFAEAFVDGREFNLALLDGPDGVQVLPPAEIEFRDFPADKPRIVGYTAKWEPESFEYRNTVRTFPGHASDAGLLANLTRLARDCWVLFGLRGWARVDFRVDGSGRPWILEINANPCLSPDAGYVAALAQADLTFAQALARIVDVACPNPKRAALRAGATRSPKHPRESRQS